MSSSRVVALYKNHSGRPHKKALFLHELYPDLWCLMYSGFLRSSYANNVAAIYWLSPASEKMKKRVAKLAPGATQVDFWEK